MATVVVLSPQDCLPLTHNYQKSFLSSARSENSIFKAVMVPSPASQDCARRIISGGSPPGDGILPVPLVHRKVRVPAKKACPQKVPSASTVTSISRTFHESSPSIVKSKLLGSSSAILPTPSVGSPPLAEGLLKERLPLKAVQGNEPGNNIDHYQGTAMKKVVTQRHRAGKKPIAAQNHVSSMTANGKFERSNSASKILHEDGAVSRGQVKEMMVRTYSKSERSSSQRAACEKEDLETDFPAITILQRPKSDEAAVKLFAKFFQSGMEQDIRDPNEEIEMMLESSERLYAMVEEKERDGNLVTDESSVPDSTDVSTYEGVLVESAAPFVKSGPELKKGVEDTALVDPENVAASIERAPSDGDPLRSSKACIWEASCEELATWERWAGPSYINSPPPSALPLPRFSKKLMKIVAVGSGCAEQQFENAWSDQLSSTPASLSPLFVSLARQQHLNINADAVATATRDLKRMLNLDLCRV